MILAKDEEIAELKRQLESRPSDVPTSTGSLRLSALDISGHVISKIFIATL